MFNKFKKEARHNIDNEPKKKTLYTITLDTDQLEKLRKWCDKQLWSFYSVDHALFAFKGNQVNLVAYKSGKLVIQGKKTEDFVTFVLEGEITKEPKLGYDHVNHPEWFEPHAGLDESGKGDLFGPVVCACVIADGPIVEQWLQAGIQDSKNISSDAAILKLEKLIRSTKGAVVTTIFASMPKYNQLYSKFNSNMNTLLAWQHAKCLQQALEKKRVPWALLDQFTKKPLVQNYFKNDPIEVRMRTKAESDPIVAAASIIARATFIQQMQKLSDACGQKLAKGVSQKAKEQGKAIIDQLGPDQFVNYAKLHFRTSFELLGLPVPPKVEWK